jgi:hypothetical protein
LDGEELVVAALLDRVWNNVRLVAVGGRAGAGGVLEY